MSVAKCHTWQICPTCKRQPALALWQLLQVDRNAVAGVSLYAQLFGKRSCNAVAEMVWTSSLHLAVAVVVGVQGPRELHRPDAPV